MTDDYVTRRLQRLESYVDWAQEHQQETVCNDVVPALARSLVAVHETVREWTAQAAQNDAEASTGHHGDDVLNLLAAQSYDLRQRAHAILDAMAAELRSERLDRLVGKTL